MKYRSYEDAQRRGERDVWPGCGKLGRCMPCGRVHNFDYQLGGRWIDRYQCAKNHSFGCPQPHPEPTHDFNRVGRCTRCGAVDEVRRLRGSLSPAQLELLLRVAGRHMGWIRLYGSEHQVARALERRGLGQRVGPASDTFELTAEGRAAAAKLRGKP